MHVKLFYCCPPHCTIHQQMVYLFPFPSISFCLSFSLFTTLKPTLVFIFHLLVELNNIYVKRGQNIIGMSGVPALFVAEHSGPSINTVIFSFSSLFLSPMFTFLPEGLLLRVLIFACKLIRTRKKNQNLYQRISKKN